MDQQTAVKRLRKLIGPNVGYRVNKGAADQETREAANARADELKVEFDAAVAARKARYEELLRDPEYQRLKAEGKRIEEELQKQRRVARLRRIEVGKLISAGGFDMFEIKAEGDNWDDVVEKLSKKGAA